MPDPSRADTERRAATCAQCLRPKFTAEDLERWHAEFPDGFTGKDPDWARALCWTKPGLHCHCRPTT